MKKSSNPENYLIRLLAKRDYTSFEIKEKLLNRFNLSDNEIGKILDKFKRLGYVNDEKYKDRFIVSKLLSREGPFLIAQKLKLKGIDVNIEEINEVAQKNGIDILENAKLLAKKKLRQYHEMTRDFERKKVFEFLVRKGYDYNLAKKTIVEVLDESDFSKGC